MRARASGRLVDWLWPGVILSSAIAVVVLAAVDVATPLRTLLSVWFLAVCPGMAWARVVGFPDPAWRWTFAIASSVSFELLLALGMVYGGLWSVGGALALLAILAVIGALLDVLVVSRRRAVAEAGLR